MSILDIEILFILNSQKCFNILIENNKFKNEIEFFKIMQNKQNNKDENQDSQDFYANIFEGKKICEQNDLLQVCRHGDSKIVNFILNNKVVPTKECYGKALINKNINEIPSIVSLLIKYGYKISNDDIIYAAKYKTELYDCQYTRNFIPTLEYFSYCTNGFAPVYNDNCKCHEWYNNLNGIKKLFSDASKASDFQSIYKLSSRNIKFDDECLEILDKKSHIKSKCKDNLIKYIKTQLKKN